MSTQRPPLNPNTGTKFTGRAELYVSTLSEVDAYARDAPNLFAATVTSISFTQSIPVPLTALPEEYIVNVSETNPTGPFAVHIYPILVRFDELLRAAYLFQDPSEVGSATGHSVGVPDFALVLTDATVLITLGGLKPFTDYYIATAVDYLSNNVRSAQSRFGRFTTLAAPGVLMDAPCQHQPCFLGLDVRSTRCVTFPQHRRL